MIDAINDLMNEEIKNCNEIKIRDNKKNLTYVISKDDTNFNIKIEKSIKSNDNINELFEKIKQYIESIGNSNEYWPCLESEYPNLMVL